MQFTIRHLFRDLGSFYVTSFFNEFYQKLISRFPQHSFIIKNEPQYENNGYGSIYSCMNFSIINPTNDKYIVLSFFDNWKYHFMQHLGWKPSKMVQFFYPGGFNYIDYFTFKKYEKDNPDICCPSDIQDRYHSFFYGPYEAGSLEIMESLFKSRSTDTTIPELYFRGYMWDFRELIVDNIKDTSILIIDKNNDNQLLDYNTYLKDLSQYRAAISLPGGTEVCNRDIECFGAGIPVIRPYLNIQYPDPLIPNYHYVSCYTDCKYWDGNPWYLNYTEFAEYLEYYWNKIKDNSEYLNFISINARNWFIKNCTLQNNINYVLSKIDLEALNG